MGLFSSSKARPDGPDQLEPSYVIYSLQAMLVEQPWYGLPGTNGSYWSNYIAHLRNEHSVFSIWTANMASPFEHHERAIFLFCCLSYVFFITLVLNTIAIEDDVGKSFVVVILSTSLIVPFKKLVRSLMECGFLFKQTEYKPEKVHESNATKYNMNSEYQKQTCVNCLGSCCTCCIGVGALTMLIIGLIWATTQDRYDGFLGSWVATQFLTVTISEPATEFVTGLIIWKYFDPKGKFEKIWGKYYRPDLGEPIPHSLTDVGLKAKAIYIKQNGERAFAMKYGFGTNIQYDKWLRIDENNMHYTLPQHELEKLHGSTPQPAGPGTPMMASPAPVMQVHPMPPSDADKQAAFQEINNLRTQANLKPLTFQEWSVAV